MRRPALILAVLTLAHFAASLGLLALSFGAGMSRFDSGAAPGTAERMVDAVSALLSVPLVPLAAALPRALRPAGPPWEHLVFLANSALWGGAVTLAIHRWRQHLARRDEFVQAGV